MKERIQTCFVLLMLLLFESGHSSITCNLNLLSTFKLKGIRQSVNDQMQICPQVYNRCCSLMDEVRIVQLWNIYGLQQVRIFSSNVVNLYKQFYQLHTFFQRVSIQDMVFHYLSFNYIRPYHRSCNQNTRFLSLKRWGKFLELQRMFPGTGPVRRVGSNHRFDHLFQIIKRLVINDADEVEGDDRFTHHWDDSGFQPTRRVVTRNHRKLLQEMLGPSIEKFSKIQTDYNQAAIAFQKESFRSDHILDHLPKRLKRKLRKVVKSKNLMGQKHSKKKPQSKLDQQTKAITIFVPRGNSYLHRFQFFTRMRVPFIPVNTEIPIIQCKTRKLRVMKPFLILNEDKFHFCQLMIEKLNDFELSYVMSNLENIKLMLTNLLELKKSIYCSICDASNQQLFDSNRQLIVYSQEFCFDILNRYKDYIFFKNIEFVNYVDTLMQVQECAQSTGDETTFPSVNRISWMKRRIPFIQRCYENLEKPDYYVYCRFMCVQYRIQDYSKFFEGDIKMLSEIFSAMTSFLRSKSSKKVTHSEDVDVLRVPKSPKRNKTSMSSSKQLKDSEIEDDQAQSNFDVTEQQLSVYVDVPTETGVSEHYIKGEIFERIQKPIQIENFRSFFATNSIGINPITTYSLIDFRVKIEDLLLEQSRRTTRENLEIGAIEGYFDSKDSMVNEFNTSVDLKFNAFIQDPTAMKNQILKKKIINPSIKKPKITPIGLAQKTGEESLKPDVPDWNKDFSSQKDVQSEPDKIATWFNYLFHTK